MKILSINGIRTDGSESTDLLLSDLEDRGFDTLDVNYPEVNILGARSRETQYENAQILLDAHEPGDALIAHSYAGLISLRAMEKGAKFGKVFWFSPAMNVDFVIPYLGCTELYVIHTLEDKAIALGEKLWWHDFGAMGRVGYQGPPDPRVTNIQAEPDERDPMIHSHYFLDGNREVWAMWIEGKLEQELQETLECGAPFG